MTLMFDQCMTSTRIADDQPERPQEHDIGQPYLMTDIYPKDLDDPGTAEIEDAPWEEMFDNNPHVVGGIVKIHDGDGYEYGRGSIYKDWGVKQLRTILELGKFGGGYLFTQVNRPWQQQGDEYSRLLEAAGYTDVRYADNAIMPILDVEESAGNNAASAQQIVAHTSALALMLKARFGRRVMFYGRGLCRDKFITSKMECDVVWNPSYTRYMDLRGLVGELWNGQQAAWTLDDIGWWQAIGDGKGENDVNHVPKELVGFGKVDVSVAIYGNQAPTMKRVRETLI